MSKSAKAAAAAPTTAGRGNVVAIVAMFFLFAMISFVTNLAAPLGVIWANNYDWSGMLGNMMNFLAYLFMGIPAGNMLVRIGYKKTALIAMVVGLVGLVFQWLSGFVGTETAMFTVGADAVTLNFIIYLLGAFICGFCVCMLNTVRPFSWALSSVRLRPRRRWPPFSPCSSSPWACSLWRSL